MATDEASQQANRSGMDPQRLVVIFYFLSAIVVALFLDHVLGAVWARLGWSDPELWDGGWHLSTVIGGLIAVGIAGGCWMTPRIRSLSQEVATELMKVTWPSWHETRSATLAVVVASLVSAALLFGIDTLSYKMMVEWIPALWGKL